MLYSLTVMLCSLIVLLTRRSLSLIIFFEVFCMTIYEFFFKTLHIFILELLSIFIAPISYLTKNIFLLLLPVISYGLFPLYFCGR